MRITRSRGSGTSQQSGRTAPPIANGAVVHPERVLETKGKQEWVHLRLAGEVNARRIGELRQALVDLGRPAAVVVDLAAVRSIDATTYSLLRFMLGRLAATGTRVVLHGASSEVGRYLHVMGTERVFEVCPTSEPGSHGVEIASRGDSSPS